MSTRRLGIGCGDGAEDHGDGELKKVVKVKSRVMEEEEETKLIVLVSFHSDKFMRSKLETQSRLKVTFSTRTVKALAEVEAFALEAEELKFVASQFRRLHSRQVEQTFRLYSQQWRTWASSFIEAAWNI
ncbi:hypothetical protein Bca52824_039929 [Brassica carinata]|uniref:Uncharacterized protein n=1 Tax=Brassica carinata TaxID=52824 RepID=A0A8X7RUK0_BRACI|nr:hypothetical protein Bca52824_039929 [Brassica carinata]